MRNIKSFINKIWEVPIFYKLLQATLAGGGHAEIKKFLLKQIPKGAKKILDQGCGTGEYSLLFGKKYTGVDYDKNYIEHARKIYPGTFIVGDAAHMPLKDSQFDVTFAVGLHHHLTDTQAKKAISESLRVTKRGGKVVIIDAMLPKDSWNFPGLILRKMDRGGNVRKISDTLKLLPKDLIYQQKVISSFPFDYITLLIPKK